MQASDGDVLPLLELVAYPKNTVAFYPHIARETADAAVPGE